MSTERRVHTRIEPASVNATVLFNSTPKKGRVLDASESGLAIAFSEEPPSYEVGTEVGIQVYPALSPNDMQDIGKAKIIRNWVDDDWIKDEKGIALNLHNHIRDQRPRRLLLRGSSQYVRLENQNSIANSDIDFLGAYRRNLVDCQLKLFMLVLTVGVALAGAYFGLIYHGITLNKLALPELSFWRTMIAALPGMLAVACALLFSQKSISIQRIDAFLATIKECIIKRNFPREYKGWEIEIRKFRHIMKTKECDRCDENRKCGDLKQLDRRYLKNKSLIFNPSIDLYHLIVFTTFLTVLFLSFFAILSEIVRFQLDSHGFIFVGFLIASIFFITFFFLIYIFYHLRKGNYSFEYFRASWKELMHKCQKGA